MLNVISNCASKKAPVPSQSRLPFARSCASMYFVAYKEEMPDDAASVKLYRGVRI